MASDAEANDGFGLQVAINGDTALITAPYDHTPTENYVGSAYVFTRSGSVWTEQTKIEANDAKANDRFGSVMALSGNTVIFRSYSESTGVINSGSVYVFTGSGAVWTQQAKLDTGDAATWDKFGNAVSLDGDTALVGAYLDDSAGGYDSGSAYVFTRNGGIWTQRSLEPMQTIPLPELMLAVPMSSRAVVPCGQNRPDLRPAMRQLMTILAIQFRSMVTQHLLDHPMMIPQPDLISAVAMSSRAVAACGQKRPGSRQQTGRVQTILAGRYHLMATRHLLGHTRTIL